MKKILSSLLLLGTLAFAANLNGAGEKLYQVSTIDALLAGHYDGDKKVADIRSNGDFGLGTFNGIDGEMVVHDNVVYQVKSTGKVLKADNDIGVPFASVHFFKSDLSGSLKNIDSYKNLKVLLDDYKECKNYPCGFKIKGTFGYIKTRSAPKASKPYPPLVEHIVKTQNFFEEKNIKGTLIGYRLPKYFAKFNVPGYHFHFLSDDKKFGGHVLELSLQNAQMHLDKLYDLDIALLRMDEFEKGVLKVGNDDLEKVEKDIKK